MALDVCSSSTDVPILPSRRLPASPVEPFPVDDPSTPPPPERWVILFYRDKNDAVGKNMSPANPHFENQLAKNLALALEDLAKSTSDDKHYDTY